MTNFWVMASAQTDAYSIFRDELCKHWQSMLLLVLLKPEDVINPRAPPPQPGVH